jgi:hypothetical protein
MHRFIVELEPGVYLDTPYSIPSKTKDLQSACRFGFYKQALVQADQKGSKVLKVKVDPKSKPKVKLVKEYLKKQKHI